jgi:D-3-phosphoglycerate dehydrogenase
MSANTGLKILISDSLSTQGVELLEKSGFTVVVKSKMPKDELFKEIKDADGLIVRSGTKVTAELIEAAPKLKIVGRAGSGLDNVDTPAATKRGIVVMNTPGGNTVTTAEHTMSMICAMSRRIPQATASVKAGKWEKDKFMGVELYNKVLGIVGVGQIGSHLTKMAQGIGMRVIAYDPYLAADRAEKMGVTMMALPDCLRVPISSRSIRR